MWPSLYRWTHSFFTATIQDSARRLEYRRSRVLPDTSASVCVAVLGHNDANPLWLESESGSPPNLHPISLLPSDLDCASAVEEQVVAAVCRPCERTDTRSSQDYLVERAVLHASTGCVWDLYHPYVAALCKPYIPGLLYSLIVCVSLFLLLVALKAAAGNEVQGVRFRFTPLELRDGTPPAATGGESISSFGVYRRCLRKHTHERARMHVCVHISSRNISP